MIDSETQTIFLPLGIYGAIENEACGLDVDYDSLPTKFEDYERFICRGSGSGYTSSGEFTVKEDNTKPVPVKKREHKEDIPVIPTPPPAPPKEKKVYIIGVCIDHMGDPKNGFKRINADGDDLKQSDL